MKESEALREYRLARAAFVKAHLRLKAAEDRLLEPPRNSAEQSAATHEQQSPPDDEPDGDDYADRAEWNARL